MNTITKSKDSYVRSRIDSELKAQAMSVLNDCGLNLSTAFRIFLERVVSVQGLPFDVVRNPSATSRQALKEARSIQEGFNTIEDLLEDLDDKTSAKEACKHS